MRFHESVPKLVSLLKEVGVPISDETAIIRDHRGRLMVAFARVEEFPTLQQRMTEALQGYAGSPAVIGGELAIRLLKEASVRIRTTREGDRFAFLDRRIVGADWLQRLAPESKDPKRLVFASIKGGVGRSTALAVLAADLARSGKRVLAIDLDVEAPGIGSMLLRESNGDSDQRPRFGVVDYLVENSLGGIRDEDLIEFVGVAPFEDGSVDVIPVVGRETDQHPETMIAKLSRALIEDPAPGHPISVTEQVAELISRFTGRLKYDAVLVDARAGLAEVTASPLIGLGAEVLFFGVDQPQTFRGYSYLLSHLSALWTATSASEFAAWRERVHFVHAKAPSATSKRAGFRERVYELCSDFLYEAETLAEDGTVQQGSYQPAPAETGESVPHDASYILNHPDYEAFDPLREVTQLDPEVYQGPFGPFLVRARSLLGLARDIR